MGMYDVLHKENKVQFGTAQLVAPAETVAGDQYSVVRRTITHSAINGRSHG